MTGAEWALLIEGLGKVASTVGNAVGGGDDQAEANQHMTREQILIAQMNRDAQTRQRNTGLEATTPIKQMLLNKVLGGTPGGLETANAMPRTWQSAPPPMGASGQQPNQIGRPGQPNAPWNPSMPSLTPPTQTPGQPDFLGRPTQQTQYGQAATPQQLAQLVPNFSAARQKQFGDVQALTSQITADKFKGEEIIPQLNANPLTRGEYTWNDTNPRNSLGREVVSQSKTDPQGQVQGEFRDEEGDGLNALELRELNAMVAANRPAIEIANRYLEFANSRNVTSANITGTRYDTGGGR